jgi:hypothetical protein
VFLVATGNLKLLGFRLVEILAQKERTPANLRTTHLDRVGKILVEVSTLDHHNLPLENAFDGAEFVSPSF